MWSGTQNVIGEESPTTADPSRGEGKARTRKEEETQVLSHARARPVCEQALLTFRWGFVVDFFFLAFCLFVCFLLK